MTPRQHWKNWWKVKASNWCACLAADVDGVEVALTIQIDLCHDVVTLATAEKKPPDSVSLLTQEAQPRCVHAYLPVIKTLLVLIFLLRNGSPDQSPDSKEWQKPLSSLVTGLRYHRPEPRLRSLFMQRGRVPHHQPPPLRPRPPGQPRQQRAARQHAVVLCAPLEKIHVCFHNIHQLIHIL